MFMFVLVYVDEKNFCCLLLLIVFMVFYKVEQIEDWFVSFFNVKFFDCVFNLKKIKNC